MKSKVRKIELLTEEEISIVMSGLRLFIEKMRHDNDSDNVLFTEELYSKVNNAEEVGCIVYE